MHRKTSKKQIRFKDKAIPLLGYFKTLLLSYQKYKLEVDKLPNVSFSVFRDLRNNSLDIKKFPADAFSGLENLKEM